MRARRRPDTDRASPRSSSVPECEALVELTERHRRGGVRVFDLRPRPKSKHPFEELLQESALLENAVRLRASTTGSPISCMLPGSLAEGHAAHQRPGLDEHRGAGTTSAGDAAGELDGQGSRASTRYWIT